jgi:uncharacterized protein YyaL (SSP411 family)
MNDTTPSSGSGNQLAGASSPYLRSAAHQPVRWYPWGEEAFLVSQRENRPILLDIGAVWCHWCHVMDAESYENETTAGIINDNYVAIKVDRDERPDVDSRYQAAVSAISGQGGWPLTAFLTPDGQVFFGGTYFPPEDRYGRTGFPKVLELLAETFRKEPAKVVQNAEQVKQVLQNRSKESRQSRELSDTILSDALALIIDQADLQNGGFGSAPKFPHCSTIEFLLASYDRLRDNRMLNAVTVTLRQMARGGIYDQLGGGFHRYSTDNNWIVPHFEKMLYDNAPLLTNYIHTYQATGDEFFKVVALDILRFSDSVLSDRNRGGFYSSQDADVAAGDDGSYFTWSFEDTKSILNDDECELVQEHFGFSLSGQMHSDPTQNVLHVQKDVADIASSLGKPVSQVIATVNSAKKKMLASRLTRRSPYVDKSVYANWNGMMIAAYFEAFKVFDNEDCLRFGLKTLNRILDEHVNNDGTISHRSVVNAQEGFLDDQIEIANALLCAFEVTSTAHYLEKADSLMRQTIALFGDEDRGGFFDVPSHHRGRGLLSIANKPIQDSPVAGANSVAVSVLNKLSVLTNDLHYRTFAEKTLKHFSGSIEHYGIYASQFYLVLDEFLHPPPHIAIINEPEDENGGDLFRSALATYRPGKSVALYRPSAPQTLPGVLRSTAGSYARPVAYVCSQFNCASPAFDRNTLISTIQSFGRS